MGKYYEARPALARAERVCVDCGGKIGKRRYYFMRRRPQSSAEKFYRICMKCKEEEEKMIKKTGNTEDGKMTQFGSVENFIEFTIEGNLLKTHFRMHWSSDPRKDQAWYDHMCKMYIPNQELVNSLSLTRKKAAYAKKKKYFQKKNACEHQDLGSLGWSYGERATCPFCGAENVEVW